MLPIIPGSHGLKLAKSLSVYKSCPRCAPNGAGQGAVRRPWWFQGQGLQRRPAPFGAQPEGTGPYGRSAASRSPPARPVHHVDRSLRCAHTVSVAGTIYIRTGSKSASVRAIVPARRESAARSAFCARGPTGRLRASRRWRPLRCAVRAVSGGRR